MSFGYQVLGFGGGVEDPAFIAATGPDSAAGTIDGDYKYHIFNTTKVGSAGFVVSNKGNSGGSNTLEYLIIAGGGGGGVQHGGGGGGGGNGTLSAGNAGSGVIILKYKFQ